MTDTLDTTHGAPECSASHSSAMRMANTLGQLELLAQMFEQIGRQPRPAGIWNAQASMSSVLTQRCWHCSTDLGFVGYTRQRATRQLNVLRQYAVVPMMAMQPSCPP
jgi:hypothetical protein